MTWNGIERRKGRRPLDPDPEMWAAFRDGAGLREILVDFYTTVLDDERLKPFFVNITKERIIQKQFAFLKSILTGEKCYFGNRPRNAHHWMVISEELFEYREALLEAAMRRYQLPDHLIKRFRTLDEAFRKQIIKDQPFPMRLRGMTFPLEGFDAIELAISTLCDECSGEIVRGEYAVFHVRTGRTWCLTCKSLADAGIDIDAPEEAIGTATR